MNRAIAGISIMAIIIVTFSYFYYYDGTNIVRSSVDTFAEKYSSGDEINIIKEPVISALQKSDLYKSATGNTVTDQNLPTAFTNLAQKQNPTITVNQTNKTKPEISGGLSKGYISSDARLMPSTIEAGTPIHHVGDVVFVTGWITTTKLPQNLGVSVTCCEMDAYIQSPDVATDKQGNFIYSIKTSPSFPLGLWTVAITWTGNDGNLKTHDWQFILEN